MKKSYWWTVSTWRINVFAPGAAAPPFGLAPHSASPMIMTARCPRSCRPSQILRISASSTRLQHKNKARSVVQITAASGWLYRIRVAAEAGDRSASTMKRPRGKLESCLCTSTGWMDGDEDGTGIEDEQW